MNDRAAMAELFPRIFLSCGDASCRFLEDLCCRVVIDDVADDFDPSCILLADDLVFPASKRIVFEDHIGSGDPRGEAEVLNAVHNKSERDGLQRLDHCDPSRIINERPPFAFALPDELIGINADDQHVAISAASGEVEDVVKVDEVERSRSEADRLSILTCALEVGCDDLDCGRVIEIKEHGGSPSGGFRALEKQADNSREKRS